MTWATVTYMDEPTIILRWRSWNVRLICITPLLFGSSIVGWTMSTNRNGGGPWMKWDRSIFTSALHSQTSLYSNDGYFKLRLTIHSLFFRSVRLDICGNPPMFSVCQLKSFFRRDRVNIPNDFTANTTCFIWKGENGIFPRSANENSPVRVLYPVLRKKNVKKFKW